MSEENKEQPAKPAATPAEPPPPPEPGKYGQLMANAGIGVQHLGRDANGVEILGLAPWDAHRGAEFLRDNPDCRFDMLVYVSGVDWRGKDGRDTLESVYYIYSLETHEKIAIKILAEKRGEDFYSPSLTCIWPAADWHERETFDLFGIHYEGHPKLERILMPNDWLGFPLRKDYKVTDPRLVWNER